jgi:phosphoenolpyruvate carboxylase
MQQQYAHSLQQFQRFVETKFRLYNSLFTSLPFNEIDKTGLLLSLFLNHCEDGYNKGKSPGAIISHFFSKHTNIEGEKEQLDVLFRFTQFAERQVVLFDALEDAAFADVNDTGGSGTLKQLALEIQQDNKQEELAKKLKDFSVRMVLTAHPTQFYPGAVLGIIYDLSKALAANNTPQVNSYLQQLGKTAFFKKEKPSPYDEAVSLLWYLENIFYPAGGRIATFLKEQFPQAVNEKKPVLTMGFWPGGDRDGNPFVKTDTTLKVTDALRGGIIKCYYLDIRRIRRRLTFKGVDTIIADLEKQLYNNIFIPGNRTELDQQYILDKLQEARAIIIQAHNGLFVHLLDQLINKVNIFGLHFASLDVRQESSVHNKVLEAVSAAKLFNVDYAALGEDEKLHFLSTNQAAIPAFTFEDELVNDTLASIKAIKTIQSVNGEPGCNRYIISQCNSALNVLEVYGLFMISGWKPASLSVDIVPLFETISDLQHATAIMQSLYENKDYAAHLERRNNTQTIMLGFSDGTKDGGYLMANWSIYKAKEALTAISLQYGIDVVFFDGRGGPPARGGGKTHKFYASMGNNISNKEIQLTIQGQTVSSNFGNIDSAQFNIEQLINAGISNFIYPEKSKALSPEEEILLEELSTESLQSYVQLKEHPQFLDYLLEISPLKFYSETNIGSRPAKRGTDDKWSIKDFRAIPFVGAWSQVKQNVTGYYGVGKALQQMEVRGKFEALKDLHHHSLFFRTLIDNCEMAMTKCFFPLTAHLSGDEKFGEIWNMIRDEFELTLRFLEKLTGKKGLMIDYPVERHSIMIRERIVLPLVTIQQFAIARIRALEAGGDSNGMRDIYEKLVIRCSFGIINAGRNAA